MIFPKSTRLSVNIALLNKSDMGNKTQCNIYMFRAYCVSI